MSKRASTRARAAPGSMKEISDSDEEEVHEDPEQEAASEDEDVLAGERPKKRAKKQANKQQPLEAVLGGTLPTPLRKKKAGQPIVIDQGQLTLLELLVKHPEAAPAAAKAWVEKYKQEPVPGTADLLSLVVQVAGACVVVTEEDVEEGDTDSLAQRLAESVAQEGGADPLHDRRTTRTLPAAFASFCTTLMAEMDESELLAGSADDFALDKLLHMVMSLSSSNIRPFRLAATLCASCLVDGLVLARKKRAEALSTAQFQLDSETKKGKAANQSLLKSLKQTVDGYQRQSDVLSAHITELIKTVFAVRFRDKQPEVRARVIYSIGHWVATEPAAFLVDMHLKYLGWALSDKEAIVRTNAVNAILKLYQEPANVQGLRDFKGRFLERMKELPYDVDEGVAIKGLELLARLVALKEVEPGQVQDMAALLSDESAPLRAAAAEVVTGVLTAQVEARVQDLEGAREEPAKTGAATKGRGQAAAGGKGKQQPAADIKHAQVAALLDLMAWLQPVDEDQGAPSAGPLPPLEEQVVGLLVDSLCDRYLVLHDVGHLATMLGSNEVVEGKVGGPAGASHLAALLAHVVQRTHSGEQRGTGSTGAATKGGRAGARKKTDTHKTHQEFTQALMGVVPNLIRQYQTEPAVLAPLLHVAGCLQLEVFAMQGEERALGALLALVAEQVLRHTDARVLQEAAECLVGAATSGPGSLRAAAQLALGQAVSKVGSGLASSAKAVFSLSRDQLAAQVEELASAGQGTAAVTAEVPEGAEVLWRLKASLLRCAALLTHGASQLSAHAGARTALAQLLQEAGAGAGRAAPSSSRSRSSGGSKSGPRPLGADVLGLVLVASQAALMSDLLQTGVTSSTTEDVTAAGEEAGPPQSPAAMQTDNAAAGTPGGKGAKKQPAKAKKGKPTKRKGRKGKEGDEEEEEEGEEEGTGAGQARVPEEAVKQLAEAVQAHAACLLQLYDVCEDDMASRELVMRAISDLLLVFGHNTWKGTAAEAMRVPDHMAQQLVQRCWECCMAVLNQASEGEQALAAQDPDEEAIDARMAEAAVATRATLAARRVLALGVPVRLLLGHSVLATEQRSWLAAHLLSQIAFHGPEAKQLIRELVVVLRRQQQPNTTAEEHAAPDSPAALPPIDKVPAMSNQLMGALELAYEAVFEEAAAQEQAEQEAMAVDSSAPPDTESLERALNNLQHLAVEIAGLYAVAGVHREEVVGLLRRGVVWVLACAEPRPRMYLMAWALAHLVPKLTPADARLLLAEVHHQSQAALQAAPRSEEGEEEGQDPHWAQVDHFVGLLEDRAAKGVPRGAVGGGARGRARGAMKGSRAAAAKADAGMGRGAATTAGADGEAEGEAGAGEQVLVAEAGASARKRGRSARRQGEGAAGEDEEEERPRMRARFTHTGDEEDPVAEERPAGAGKQGAGAGRKAVGRGAAGKQAQVAPPAPEGWHRLDRTSPAKRGATERTATIPIASLQATSSEDEEEEEEQRRPAARMLFNQSQPLSEDHQLPRLPTAPGSATRTRPVPGAFQAATPSQGARSQSQQETDGGGEEGGGFQAATPSQQQSGQEEEGGEGEEFQSAESDGEGSGSEQEGGSIGGAPAPSQSTQVSEPPPRVVRRRRL